MRIFHPAPLTREAEFFLTEQASNHVARVLRAKVGDKIRVFNGQGGEFEGIISHVNKKGVAVRLMAFIAREVESPIAIQLAQGIARGEKMDFIVQKAVELGISQIIPLMSERCNVKLIGERRQQRVAHWQSIMISACEQCGRNKIPLVTPIQSLASWLSQDNSDLRLLLSPEGENTLSFLNFSNNNGLNNHKLHNNLTHVRSVTLLIGPEGGFSPPEEQQAKEKGYVALCLGPRILRAETASIVALSLIQSYFGDLAGNSNN